MLNHPSVLLFRVVSVPEGPNGPPSTDSRSKQLDADVHVLLDAALDLGQMSHGHWLDVPWCRTEHVPRCRTKSMNR